MMKLKLTHWVKAEVEDMVLAKADFSLIVEKLKIDRNLLEGREEISMKPKGFWLSVNGSWEEWLKGNWESWYDGMVCLEAELSKDINLLVINSKEDFFEAFKKYTGIDYGADWKNIANIIFWISQKKFHENIMKDYDGMWMKENVIRTHRLDFNCYYFYSWDAESICVWNKEKIKFKKIDEK